jgi:hypothetical protein
MLFTIAIFAVGVVVGAYSHKWLAKVTGAPANLSSASVAPAVKAAESVVKKVV